MEEILAVKERLKHVCADTNIKHGHMQGRFCIDQNESVATIIESWYQMFGLTR